MAASSSDGREKWYHHERLASPRHIRLLRLLYSTESANAVEVELLEVSLDAPASLWHSYEALSYVWGSRTGTDPIICNGKILLVTPSCESALRHLRLNDRGRVLWIDAICIDQADTVNALLERNAQVASMGEIYSKADRTLCWLGEGTTYSHDVMRHLERIGTCPSQRGFAKLMEFEKRLRSNGFICDDASCLDHIFCHPWHSRIWTVQEVAFSKRCKIVCGTSSISWEQYYSAGNFLILENYIDALELQASRSMVSIDMRNVFRDYIIDKAGSKSLSNEEKIDEGDKRITFLTSCLADANQLRATDPKDKFYGLHALYTKFGVLLPPIDYSESIASVYTGATLAMISWSRSLKVLGDACSINREPSLPSWVPDWNNADARMFIPTSDATQGSSLADATAAKLSPESGRLLVRGKVVGEVLGADHDRFMLPMPTRASPCGSTILSGPTYRVVDDAEFLSLLIEKIRFFRELLRAIEVHADFFPDDETEDVFHEMLTLGASSFRSDLFELWLDLLAYPNGLCDQSIGEDIAARWRAADSANSAEWNFETISCATIAASLVSEDSILVDGRPSSSHADGAELVKGLSENLGDHTVIVVQLTMPDSNTLGTTFQAVKAGDCVALLEGAPWPVVLRASRDTWTFVGPAYVRGIMDGEAWSEERAGQGAIVTEFILT